MPLQERLATKYYDRLWCETICSTCHAYSKVKSKAIPVTGHGGL
jgi:hypothetical protein